MPKKGEGKAVGPRPGRPDTALKPSPATVVRAETTTPKKACVPKGSGPRYAAGSRGAGRGSRSNDPARSTNKRPGNVGGSNLSKKPRMSNSWDVPEAEVDELVKMKDSELAEEMRVMSRRVSNFVYTTSLARTNKLTTLL